VPLALNLLPQDTLADIGCMEGQLIAWSEDAVGWVCGDDADTVRAEDDVDGMVADNGYAMASERLAGCERSELGSELSL
jgi:hypothetical protein